MELTKEHFDNVVATLATRSELSGLKADLAELAEKVDRIDKRDKEDSNLYSKMLLNHEGRIKLLENRLKAKQNLAKV
ncbi:MAG TPA: hypothetical protein VHQ20_01545 [Patescibacteria group bacterium]|jgi:hypothetical protein|nr:hypothetical protein [Patescibacteria group bacterium]